MKRIEKAFKRSIKVYEHIFKFTLGFSVFILLSILILPLLSGYVSVGGGFLRFSSIIFDMTLEQAFIFSFIGLLCLLFLSFFLSAMITIIKLKETLDHVRFSKVMATFPKYVLKIFLFLLFLTLLSIITGTILDYYLVPRTVIHLILACLWLPFIFAPQIIILEDFGVNKAITDSIQFIKKCPLFFIAYILLGLILLFLLTCLEVFLGKFFIWEHKLVSIILLSVLILPFLQVFATQLYILRYPLAHH